MLEVVLSSRLFSPDFVPVFSPVSFPVTSPHLLTLSVYRLWSLETFSLTSCSDLFFSSTLVLSGSSCTFSVCKSFSTVFFGSSLRFPLEGHVRQVVPSSFLSSIKDLPDSEAWVSVESMWASPISASRGMVLQGRLSSFKG